MHAHYFSCRRVWYGSIIIDITHRENVLISIYIVHIQSDCDLQHSVSMAKGTKTFNNTVIVSIINRCAIYIKVRMRDDVQQMRMGNYDMSCKLKVRISTKRLTVYYIR